MSEHGYPACFVTENVGPRQNIISEKYVNSLCELNATVRAY